MRYKLHVMGMECLQSQCIKTRMNRWRNKEVSRGSVREKKSHKVDQKVLKWFGHIKRMSREQFTSGLYECEVEGRNNRGRL